MGSVSVGCSGAKNERNIACTNKLSHSDESEPGDKKLLLFHSGCEFMQTFLTITHGFKMCGTRSINFNLIIKLNTFSQKSLSITLSVVLLR